jgi:uncharacterized membrane protein YedE/YeeE
VTLDWAVDFIEALVDSLLFFVAAIFVGAFAIGCLSALVVLIRAERPLPAQRRPGLRIVRRRRIA